MSWIRRLKLSARPAPQDSPDEPGPDAEQQKKLLLERILRALESPERGGLACEQVFALLDQFAEQTKRGEDTAVVMPLVKRHLETCSECHEEYQVLLRMLEE